MAPVGTADKRVPPDQRDAYGAPTVGVKLSHLPWSMGYWGSHNVYTQPGSFSEALSTVPYQKFTYAKHPLGTPRPETASGAITLKSLPY